MLARPSEHRIGASFNFMRPKNTNVPDPRKVIIPKDELYQKYIIENLTRKECANYFNVGEGIIIKRLSEYGIKRDVEATKINRKKAIFEKYGYETPFGNKEIREKSKITMQTRYGVEYTAQSKDLQNKMKKTMFEKYGKNNYVETAEFHNKSRKTCLKKYGIEHPCQTPQCIKALEESMGHSKPEMKFANLLDSYGIKYQQEAPLRGFKYDFKIDNLLFEINPSETHNVNFGLFGNKPKNKKYHFIKHSVAKDFGMHCVHIFDWDDPEKIIKLFLLPKERIYARQCELKGVAVEEARLFLEENHLQGYAKDKIRLGLYYKNKLVEIMTFDKPRYNKNYDWELVRLCSNANVVGGAEKILKYFIDTYKPKNIVSYCDLSKFDGKVYKQLGFVAVNKPQPSKHWVSLKDGRHITDNLLRQKGFDQLFKTNHGKGTNNEALMKENGFVEVYDCGQLTFVFLY